MNNTDQTDGQDHWNRRRFLTWKGALQSQLSLLLLAATFCFGLASCSFLKPAESTTRYFVLTPVLASPPAPVASNALVVGVGQVKLPGYLFNTSLAIRKGSNEVEYLPSMVWAERLDAGFQRVLAANLAILLPTDRLRLSFWNPGDVAAEVYVILEQFDVDATGRGVLVARWRIVAPGGERTLKTGEARLAGQGPAPNSDPAGAVTTLSRLLADLSRQLAQALQETTPRQGVPAPK
jgi:uncharacterized lipoprotein YmbA